ncbi:MAG TPA: TonB-dependent receptor, partial [Burkholderiaceae bacterium]|nr:TonB-dependent receptor [Burkholderiaceae bacterium]
MKTQSLLVVLLAVACAAHADMPPEPGLDDFEALLNQPVYAASKYAEQSAAAPASVTVLTAGDIRAFGWRTLGEVLQGVRSVYLRDDRTYTYLGVRGFARPGDYSSRLLLTIDGMRVNDNIYDQSLGGREFPIAVDMIERVEFIAGPGSSLYGSNALLAVVNIVTKSATALGGSNATLTLGSENVRALSLRHGAALAAGELVFGARIERRPGRDRYYPEFDAPGTNNGIAAGLDQEDDRKLYAKWSQGPWQATYLYSNRLKQTPSAGYGVDFNSPSPSRDTYHLADLQWRGEQAGGQWLVRTSLGQYQFQGSGIYGPDALHYDQKGRWLAAEARWLTTAFKDHRLVLGAEVQRNFLQRQTVEIDGPSPSINTVDGSTTRWGLFANDEWSLAPAWRLVLGARADRLLLGEHIFTPRLALLWMPSPGLHLKLLDGRAYREPNAWESQYGDGQWQIANQSLRSERLHATEMALDWRVRDNLRVAASAYRNRVTDMIEQHPDANDMLRYVNAGRASGRGVELEADWVHAGGWRVRGFLARFITSDAKSGQPLSNAPSALARVFVSGPLPVADLPGLRMGLQWQVIGARYTVAGTRMPSHALVDATLNWAPAGRPWTLAASIFN